MRLILCILLPLVGLSFASETEKEQTTEAVVKAVADAENKNESKEDKAATAVAGATMDVIKTESSVGEDIPDEILEKAKDEAKETFKVLKEAKVGTKAAADAAAKVAVAEVDGASDLAVERSVKDNAEKAAVAAGKGIVDHPDTEAKALDEAISTVKKEEERPGKVDVTKTTKGMMSKAKEAVSDLPAMAEGAAEGAVQEAQGGGVFGAFCILIIVVAMGAIGHKTYKEQYEVTPYMRSLRNIREELLETENGRQCDNEFRDVESSYSEMR